jgi:hypothetical protein
MLSTPALAGPEDQWYRSTFPNGAASLKYHCKKHGNGKPCDQYTRDAISFCKSNLKSARPMALKDGTPAIKIRRGTVGGYFKENCSQIVTFWYN